MHQKPPIVAKGGRPFFDAPAPCRRRSDCFISDSSPGRGAYSLGGARERQRERERERKRQRGKERETERALHAFQRETESNSHIDHGLKRIRPSYGLRLCTGSLMPSPWARPGPPDRRATRLSPLVTRAVTRAVISGHGVRARVVIATQSSLPTPLRRPSSASLALARSARE